MVKIKDPDFKIKTEKKKEDYGKFVIEPLEQGYGHTVGNALRRCLLTSLPGAAITRVKISGVSHPFSTIEGMKEDVIELILNLKKVRVTYDQDKEVKLSLNVKGKKDVKAGNIKASEGVKIVNKDLHLATLSSPKSSLRMDLWVSSGFGYSPSEDRKSDTVGIIPLDAVFTPIVRVNYKIEATRVGRRTDYDRLVLEVWTDGTIDAKSSLEKASEILTGYFVKIHQPKAKKVKKKEAKPKKEENKALELDVDELGLSTRVANALKRAGYEKVKDLAKAGKKDIFKVRSIGEKSVKSVISKLKKKGIEL
jgi:DNA-directed RNA polymerase subunit alpha